jgi:hypothetical protein
MSSFIVPASVKKFALKSTSCLEDAMLDGIKIQVIRGNAKKMNEYRNKKGSEAGNADKTRG